jgi:hypothetical protein
VVLAGTLTGSIGSTGSRASVLFSERDRLPFHSP